MKAILTILGLICFLFGIWVPIETIATTQGPNFATAISGILLLVIYFLCICGVMNIRHGDDPFE